jgi:hypothetical protein
VNTYKELVATVSTEEIRRLHRINRDKIVWCLQRGFIGFTGLVVIKVWCLQRGFIGYTGLVVRDQSGVYREDSYVTQD